MGYRQRSERWCADEYRSFTVRQHIWDALRILMDLTVITENGEILTFADKWIKLGIIMLSKINQT